MGESKSRMVQKQRERYSDIAMTDLDALNAAEIELQQMKRRRAEAQAEFSLAKGLALKHKGKEKEWLFYMGACARVAELQEELECLEPEIEATTAYCLTGWLILAGRKSRGA